MPGRRQPRRPETMRQTEHSRGAFRGALDGASSIPYPVRERDPNINARREVEFKTECFIVGSGTGPTGAIEMNEGDPPWPSDFSLSLTEVPIDGSIHVYWEDSGYGST